MLLFYDVVSTVSPSQLITLFSYSMLLRHLNFAWPDSNVWKFHKKTGENSDVFLIWMCEYSSKIVGLWLYSTSFGLQLDCHTFRSFALYLAGVCVCEWVCWICFLSVLWVDGALLWPAGFSLRRVLLRVRMLYYLKQEVIGSQAQKVLDGGDSRWAHLQHIQMSSSDASTQINYLSLNFVWDF